MVSTKDAAFIITPGFYQHYTSLEKVVFSKSLINLQNIIFIIMLGNEQTDHKLFTRPYLRRKGEGTIKYQIDDRSAFSGIQPRTFCNFETLPALENKAYGAHQSDEMRCRQQYFGRSI
jgi:hypothetical protein